MTDPGHAGQGRDRHPGSYSRHVAEPPVRIGVLAYDGCFGAEIFGITDLLLIANHVARRTGVGPGEVFRVSVVARRGSPVTAAGGITVGAVQWHSGLDTLVVPGFELASVDDLAGHLAGWRPETSFLSSLAARRVPLAAVCVGAFLLGEAGVLDGRPATTAWLFARELAARYPRSTVEADAMIVAADRVTTTAAFSAVHDLAMHLITRHAGEEVARLTARIALVPDNRTTQAPYVDHAVLGPVGSRFARSVQRWLVDRLDQPYDLAALSRAFDISADDAPAVRGRDGAVTAGLPAAGAGGRCDAPAGDDRLADPDDHGTRRVRGSELLPTPLHPADGHHSGRLPPPVHADVRIRSGAVGATRHLAAARAAARYEPGSPPAPNLLRQLCGPSSRSRSAR